MSRFLLASITRSVMCTIACVARFAAEIDIHSKDRQRRQAVCAATQPATRIEPLFTLPTA